MGLALDKFHEQRQLIQEAIMLVAVKHYKNTKIVLGMVQEELVSRIKNFNCQSVLPDLVSEVIKVIKLLSRE